MVHQPIPQSLAPRSPHSLQFDFPVRADLGKHPEGPRQRRLSIMDNDVL